VEACRKDKYGSAATFAAYHIFWKHVCIVLIFRHGDSVWVNQLAMT